MYNSRLNWIYFLAAAILIGLLIRASASFYILYYLIFFDLIVAITAIIRGMRSGRHVFTIGGCICALMVLSTGYHNPHPSIGDVFMIILAGAIGVGSFIIYGASKTFD